MDEFVRRVSAERRIAREALIDAMLRHAEPWPFASCSSTTGDAPGTGHNKDQTDEEISSQLSAICNNVGAFSLWPCVPATAHASCRDFQSLPDEASPLDLHHASCLKGVSQGPLEHGSCESA